MLDFDFLGFSLEKWEKTIFGSGDKVRPLQNSSWGEVGSSLDAFDQVYGWIRMTRS